MSASTQAKGGAAAAVPRPQARQIELGDDSSAGMVRKYLPMALGVLAALGLGLMVSSFVRSQRERRLAGDWEAYQALTQDITTSFSKDNLAASLEQARDAGSAYPWIILAGVRHAIEQGDRELMANLQPELERVSQTGALTGLHTVADGQRIELTTYLRQQLEREAQGAALPDFASPTPAGRRVKLTISDSNQKTYVIIFGLFEDVAAKTAERFLGAVSGGSIANQKAEPAYSSLRLSGLGQGVATPESLPLEAKWGYFRTKGALVTQIAAGGTGQQDGNQFHLLTMDEHSLEGQTTVFGMLVDGQADFDALLAALPEPGDLSSTPPTLTVTAAEIVP